MRHVGRWFMIVVFDVLPSIIFGLALGLMHVQLVSPTPHATLVAAVVGILATITCLLALRLSWVDIMIRRIPNSTTLVVALCGFAYLMLRAWVSPAASLYLTPEQVVLNVLGACGIWAILGAFSLGWRRFRGKEGMGMGDVKLVAAFTLWIQWHALTALGLACVAALIPFAVGNTQHVKRNVTFSLGHLITFFSLIALFVLTFLSRFM